VKPALESIGRLDLWRVRMKPGKPVAFGRIPRPDGGETLFFGLPGNPVSTMVTFELFARPALWKLAGRRDLARPRITVRLTEAVGHRPGRQEFIRATAVYRDGEWHAWPTGAQESHHLGSMMRANALIVASEEEGGLAQGARAEALLLGIDPVLET
jgi:molybdopterin molybdotransferase